MRHGGDTERLRRMVESDVGGAVKDTLRVVQSDIMRVLCEFMDVSRLDIKAEGNGDGYRLTITVDAQSIFGAGKVSGA